MFTLTYEYKLKPTTQQLETFEHWLEINRQVYNYALAERKDWYNSRACPVDACSVDRCYIIPANTPRPTYNTQANALTKAKEQYPQLKRVQSQVLQQTLKRLENAFTSMWERDFGFPRFKKRGRMRSFVFPQLGKNPVKQGEVKLPVIGWVRFHQSRDIPENANIKQARIVKRASGWYVMLTLVWDVSVPVPQPTGIAIGVDVGIKYYLAASNSLRVPNPRFFVTLQRQLKLLQQRVSRKKIGSNNWRQAQRKVAQLHEQITNTRKDFFWKLAHKLCDQADTIFVEDLNLTGLAKGMLGKHCLDAAWGSFLEILQQCCFKRGKFFLKVNSRGTSQICPHCLTHTGKKDLGERIHSCSNCGYMVCRDIAAALVVRLRGLAAVGQTVKMLKEGKAAALPTS